MQEDDRPLKDALRSLDATVDSGGVWNTLQAQVAARRRGRRRRLKIAGAAALAAVVLGLGTYGIIQWWPHQNDVLVIDDDSMGVAGQGSGASSGTWLELPLPQSGSVMCFSLLMDPVDPAVLYAATDEGLFVSNDGAATWTQSWAGESINFLAVDPGTPSAVYAVAPDKNGHMSLQRSLDSGATWTQMTGAAQEIQGALHIDSSVSPSVLYLSNYSEPYGLLKSTDGGATWEGIAVEPGCELLVCSGSTLFAQNYAMNGPTLIKSSDGGATWQEVEAPLPVADESGNSNGSYFLRPDPRDPSRLYLYVYEYEGNSPSDYLHPTITVHMSEDEGQSWSEVEGDQLEWAKAVESAAPGTPPAAIEAAAEFLAGFKEIQESETESTDDRPFGPADSAASVLVDPSNPAILYVASYGTIGGIYKSTDQGATWDNTTAVIATDAYVVSVMVDPQVPSTVYAIAQNSVLKSEDGGASWETIFEGGSGSLALAPSSPSILYLLTADGLSRSDDGGATWVVQAATGLPPTDPALSAMWYWPARKLLVSSESPDTILASLSDGVYRSVDGGNSWTRAAGLPGPPPEDSVLYGPGDSSLLVEASEAPSTFYAVRPDWSDGYSLRLYTSTDGGLTWTTLVNFTGGGGTSYIPSVIDPADSLTIYAEKVFYDSEVGPNEGYSGDGRLWRSTDGGSTWSRLKSQGVPYLETYSLYADPWNSGTLYTISQSGGFGMHQTIYRSRDKGDSWQKVCDGPDADDDTYLQSVVSTPDGTLYVNTGRGIYKWVP